MIRSVRCCSISFAVLVHISLCSRHFSSSTGSEAASGGSAGREFQNRMASMLSARRSRASTTAVMWSQSGTCQLQTFAPHLHLRLRGGKLSHKKSSKRRKTGEDDVDHVLDEIAEKDAIGARKKGRLARKADTQKAIEERTVQGTTSSANAKKQRTSKIKANGKKQQKEKSVPQPFLPWLHKPSKDEFLVPSLQAYDCLFPLHLEWPALSFAFLEPPNAPRKSFPFATSIAVGTQAERPEENAVQVLQLSGLRRFRRRKTAAEEEAAAAAGEDDEDESESEVYDEGVKGVKVEPRVTHFGVPHNGTVNRLAAMPQDPRLVATLADTGLVHVFNLSNAVAARRIRSYAEHTAEGFAIAWSPRVRRRLASGDGAGVIVVRDVREEGEEGGEGEAVELLGHAGSVEDVAWSPTEAGVLASASSDRSIRIWDLARRRCAMAVEAAHAADVNVIAWNARDTHLLLSGGDDGVIKVWDLRQLKPGAQRGEAGACVAAFEFHRGGISSVDWHPEDASMLVAASRDESVSVWDLSLERDEQAAEVEARVEGVADLPPQLLFLHQGQREVSEVRWHPQLPSVAFSTALDGIHIWKPSTL